MEKISTARVALKWGLVMGIALTAVYITLYVLNIFKFPWYVHMGIVVLFVGGIYMALNEFKGLNRGFMKFGEAFGLGMLTVFTSSIISSSIDFVYRSFIDKTVNDKQVEIVTREYEAMGISAETSEAMIEQVSMMLNSPLGLLVSIGTFLFIGLIVSVIMAAVMRKDEPLY